MLVGIDLGTTNSLIGRCDSGQVSLFSNALGTFLTPSIVAVDQDGGVIVGEAARELMATRPDRVAAGFKRSMGTGRQYELGGRCFRPEELSALVLKSLIADAQSASGAPIREAIISVPAYFSDSQREATRIAGELAGVRVRRLINEPTAAAIAHGLLDRQIEGRFLVFDLGGGTFDVSILEVFDDVLEVHATAGDSFLGGEDFLDLLKSAFTQDCRIDSCELSQSDTARLRRELERVKLLLSSQADVNVKVHLIDRVWDWTIDQSRFEELSHSLLSRIRAPLERVLRDSNLRADQLDEVVMVGGATRMPMVTKLVARLFGRLPLRHPRPDEVVAEGAALAAGLLGRQRELREVVLTDVAPYTLGIETTEGDPNGPRVQGVFSPIIERNTVVPCSRVQTYHPIQDFQERLDLKVYQGESRHVRNNLLLGTLTLPLPRRRASETSVDVRFTYDANGLLEVEASIRPGGTVHQLLIERHCGSLSEEEVAERLRALAEVKIHPRSQLQNLHVLARGERLYEERLGEERQFLGEWLTAFRCTLESQDRERIEQFRERFTQLLDSFDHPLLP